MKIRSGFLDTLFHTNEEVNKIRSGFLDTLFHTNEKVNTA